MKKICIIFSAAILLAACSNSAKQTEEQQTDTVEVSNDFAKENSAKIALDYQGTYQGVLPAADGPGMNVTITIDDSTYIKNVSYVDRTDVPQTETTGKYTWNEDGNTITLVGEEAPAKYFVSENTLTQLDTEGKRIEGALAEKYVLSKVN